MSVENIKKLKAEKGFTIVELLIVIVVIGILAAIVIVAYNGIQNQAKATQYRTDTQSIAKLAEAYNADETTTGYPTTGANINTYTTVKLPANVRVEATPIAAATADPSTKATAEHTEASGVKTYKWKTCGASVGLEIYYWDPAASAVKTVTAGTGC